MIAPLANNQVLRYGYKWVDDKNADWKKRWMIKKLGLNKI